MEEINLHSSVLLSSALNIDDIDQVRLSAHDEISIIWVDIAERPDLAVLREHSVQAVGDVEGTWFVQNPGKRNMIIGMRVVLLHPTPAAFVLAFEVERLVGHLVMIAKYGKLLVVPGPPQAHQVGTPEMDAHSFLTHAVNASGQGVLIELEAHLVTELRSQLDGWKRLK